MQRLGTLQEAREKVLRDGRACVERIRSLAATPFTDADAAVSVLQRIREETYEDLNQIQHEHLILRAVEWLAAQRVCPPETQWEWNPRQTGDYTEPDLRGTHAGRRLVCAEITTSSNPEGTIGTRMHGTLAKLATQSGLLFYFVRTTAMARRARTKVSKNNWLIRVVDLDAEMREAAAPA